MRRIAEKRGQELAGETIARATSDLKVYERINTFEGQLKIESAPGQGTKATIEIKMPREQ